MAPVSANCTTNMSVVLSEKAHTTWKQTSFIPKMKSPEPFHVDQNVPPCCPSVKRAVVGRMVVQLLPFPLVADLNALRQFQLKGSRQVSSVP